MKYDLKYSDERKTCFAAQTKTTSLLYQVENPVYDISQKLRAINLQ